MFWEACDTSLEVSQHFLTPLGASCQVWHPKEYPENRSFLQKMETHHSQGISQLFAQQFLHDFVIAASEKRLGKQYRDSVTTGTEADVWAKARKTNSSATRCWPTATSVSPSRTARSIYEDLLRQTQDKDDTGTYFGTSTIGEKEPKHWGCLEGGFVLLQNLFCWPEPRQFSLSVGAQ